MAANTRLADFVADTDTDTRALIAADAVLEAGCAIRARGGIKGALAQVGYDTIKRLRPGFLERQVELLLPQMAQAIDPWWTAGLANDDAPGWLNAHARQVADDLLEVTDAHVDQASDTAAAAVYRRLRPAASRRIAAEMPRVGRFLQRHTRPETMLG